VQLCPLCPHEFCGETPSQLSANGVLLLLLSRPQKEKTKRKRRLVGVCILYLEGDNRDRQQEVSQGNGFRVPKSVPTVSPESGDRGQKWGHPLWARNRLDRLQCNGSDGPEAIQDGATKIKVGSGALMSPFIFGRDQSGNIGLKRKDSR